MYRVSTQVALAAMVLLLALPGTVRARGPETRAAPPVVTAGGAAVPVETSDRRHAVTLDRYAAVFGAEDRVGLPARYGNLRHVVGLLFNVRARMVCTAFCVADDMVATAAHCLFRTRGEASPALEEFQFSRFADSDKRPTKLAGADTKTSAQFVVAGSERLSIRPPIDASSDWAIARLSRPACTQGHLAINPLGPDEINAASTRGMLYQVAFHRDVPDWQLAYSTPCSASREFPPNRWPTIASDFAEIDNLVLHTCDTGGASSGSPLLIDGASGPEVVAINVGTYVVSQQALKDGVVVRRFGTENVANTAVAARAILPKLEVLRSAVIVPPGPPLLAVQSQLRSLRLYGGPLDGKYGPVLRRAIQSFEAAVRLPVTGLATRGLVRRLGEETLTGDTGSTEFVTGAERRRRVSAPEASQRRLSDRLPQ